MSGNGATGYGAPAGARGGWNSQRAGRMQRRPSRSRRWCRCGRRDREWPWVGRSHRLAASGGVSGVTGYGRGTIADKATRSVDWRPTHPRIGAAKFVEHLYRLSADPHVWGLVLRRKYTRFRLFKVLIAEINPFGVADDLVRSAIFHSDSIDWKWARLPGWRLDFVFVGYL